MLNLQIKQLIAKILKGDRPNQEIYLLVRDRISDEGRWLEGKKEALQLLTKWWKDLHPIPKGPEMIASAIKKALPMDAERLLNNAEKILKRERLLATGVTWCAAWPQDMIDSHRLYLGSENSRVISVGSEEGQVIWMILG